MITTTALLWLGGAAATFCYLMLTDVARGDFQASTFLGDLFDALAWPITLPWLLLFKYLDRTAP